MAISSHLFLMRKIKHLQEKVGMSLMHRYPEKFLLLLRKNSSEGNQLEVAYFQRLLSDSVVRDRVIHLQKKRYHSTLLKASLPEINQIGHKMIENGVKKAEVISQYAKHHHRTNHHPMTFCSQQILLAM